MLGSLDRYLKSKKYPKSLIHDVEFMISKKVLDGKVRKLREQGLGKQPNKALTLKHEEEEALWQCGQLGCSTPRSLLNTMWWLVAQHFGLRGSEQHHHLEISEFFIEIDEKGRRYVQFIEGPSKTRQGGLNFKPRQINPRMYETGCERCPIKFFELYVSKRPMFKKSTGPFYLAPIDNPKNENIWYKNQRVGVHTINNIMKSMFLKSPVANNNKNITNHSARKTIVSKLRTAGFEKCEIKNLTGHKNVQGLDAYDEDNSDNLQQMSAVIANVACVQNQNAVSTITSRSSYTNMQSLNHHVGKDNINKNTATSPDVTSSSLIANRPLSPRNFSFGIDWGQLEHHKAASNHHYHGKVYIINDCQSVVINTEGEDKSAKKRIRVIYSSDEEN